MRILQVNNYNYQTTTQKNKQQNVNFGITSHYPKYADIIAVSMVADVKRQGVVLTGKAAMEARLAAVERSISDIKQAARDKRLTKEDTKLKLKKLIRQKAQISRGLESTDK